MPAPIASFLATGSRRLRLPLACYAAAALAGMLALVRSGAWNAGLSGADEPAHFLNAWFVSLYDSHALGHNPLAYARDFYLHYPKLSIGHWPPAYYGLVGPVFLLLPPTVHVAMAINLLVAALPALAAGLIVARLEGRAPPAIGAALLAASMPVALEGDSFFMLDQALAASVLAATGAWLAYARTGRARWAIAFALLSALAILVKGNGWLLVFLPAWHLALTGQWPLLRRTATWAGAGLAGLIVIPWYALTAGISAEGFNYRPGPIYAAQALAFNFRALAENGTLLAFALAGFAAWREYRGRKSAPERWTIVAGCLALILAALTLQSLVPADLSDRYMTPALPPLAGLALLGAVHALRGVRAAAPLAAIVFLVLLFPGASHLAAREPKADLRLEEAAAAASGGEAWLIDGGSGAEGAFVAAMAVNDPGLRRYAVRGSKLLADSDFMGRHFRLKYSDDRAVLAQLHRLGLAGIVLVRRNGVAPDPDMVQLQRALARPASGYRLAGLLQHRNRPGTTWVWRASVPVAADVAAIRVLSMPARADAALRLGRTRP